MDQGSAYLMIGKQFILLVKFWSITTSGNTMEHFLKKLCVVTTKEHTVTTLQVLVNSYLQHQYHMIANTVIRYTICLVYFQNTRL